MQEVNLNVNYWWEHVALFEVQSTAEIPKSFIRISVHVEPQDQIKTWGRFYCS